MARGKSFLIFLLSLVILQFSGSTSEHKLFREDYKYFEETESFYKIHTLSKTWDDAKRRCNLEGARLWYPRDQCEAKTVILYLNETQPQFNKIYVGISSKLAKGVFRTIDGNSLTYIYNEWKQGEPNDNGGNEDCVALRNQGTYDDVPCTVKLPFICKKTLASVHWDDKCNVAYSGYKFSEELGKCYKFHSTPLLWRDAFEMCDAEESQLAIINSEAEAKYFKDMTEKAPKDGVSGTYLQGQIHVGFSYDTADDGWRTISGDSLQDAGYSAWERNQPDGGENERCGSMFLNSGKLNDIGCEAHKCFFICEREHEIPSPPKNNCFNYINNIYKNN